MKRMSLKTRTIMGRTILALSFGVFFFGQSARPQNNCKEAKGNLSELFLPEVNSNAGALSNAGWLNGTTLHVFGPPALFPLPGVAIWTTQLTIATGQGDSKASTVTLATIQPAPKGSVIGVIDPAASIETVFLFLSPS